MARAAGRFMGTLSVLGCGVIVATMAGCATTARQAQPRGPQNSKSTAGWYIFVDATAKGQAQHATYSLSASDASKLFGTTLTDTANQCSLELPLLQDPAAAVKSLPDLAPKSSTRFISGPGDVAAVYVFYDPGDKKPSVEFTEADRDTQLVADIKQLLGGILKGTGAGTGPAVYIDCWRLTKIRSVLSIAVELGAQPAAAEDTQPGGGSSASLGAGDVKQERSATSQKPSQERRPGAQEATQKQPSAAEPPARKGAPQTPTGASPGGKTEDQHSATAKPADAKQTSASVQLITGPREHWYLSFDLPLNSVNQAKIASDNTVQPKDEPTQVYLGLNWRIGDLFTTYSGRAFAQNLVFKGILLATKHPLDSWGFELGLRGDFWKAFGIDLSAFAPFVGYTFTKEDAKTAGVLVPNGRRNSKLRGGISFNIDKGITWLKGSISGKAPAKGESAK